MAKNYTRIIRVTSCRCCPNNKSTNFGLLCYCKAISKERGYDFEIGRKYEFEGIHPDCPLPDAEEVNDDNN